MKHFKDLTAKEQAVFSDTMQDDLVVFFENARQKYNLCDLCLHNAVIMMCEAYVVQMMEEPVNGTKH